MKRTSSIAIAILLIAAVAQASWYDDYDAGLAAARAGNWSVVAAKMSAAIKGNGNENNKARTYGMDFRNYHPYYYRGVANLNLGRYEQAIADLEKTQGPGPENLGAVETLLDRAKKQLSAASEPAPEPTPVQTKPAPTPAPVTPSAPAMDPALRQRAGTALGNAKQKLQAAQQRRANGSPQFAQAMQMFTDASTRNGNAKNNDDLNSVITMADNAGDLADLAMAPSVAATTPAPAPSPAPSTIAPKPTAATSAVMSDYTNQVRRALENYFAGEFDQATRDFEDLSRKMPRNGWIWAFLGASHYSQYAFEADPAHRAAALTSFKKAKQLRSWKGGLPSKYFSKRIRRAFENV